jgi:uncharacterized membrane protein
MAVTAWKQQTIACLLGACEVLFCMALSVWFLTLPPVFRAYYPALRVSPHEHDAAAVVSWLSSSHRERSLNLALTDGKLGEKELRHFSDVRRVFRPWPKLLLVLGGLTVFLIAAAPARRPALRAAQWRGLLFWAALVFGIGGLAWLDWPRFFAWVHHPFFGDVSWRLPDNCYSLVLFPSRFWRMAAAFVLFSPALGLGLFALLVNPATAAPVTSGSEVAGVRHTHPPAPGERTPTIP